MRISIFETWRIIEQYVFELEIGLFPALFVVTRNCNEWLEENNDGHADDVHETGEVEEVFLFALLSEVGAEMSRTPRMSGSFSHRYVLFGCLILLW